MMVAVIALQRFGDSVIHSKNAIEIASELTPLIGYDYPLSWNFICLVAKRNRFHHKLRCKATTGAFRFARGYSRSVSLSLLRVTIVAAPPTAFGEHDASTNSLTNFAGFTEDSVRLPNHALLS